MGEEIWKDIDGYNGLYQVSNLGRVKSVKRYVRVGYGRKRIVKERIMKPILRNDGYCVVGLWKNNKCIMHLIHRLVGKAFVSNPNNLPAINHIDENPSNNNENNLEWCTTEYNNKYGKHIERGAVTQGTKINQYDLEGNFINQYYSIKQAGRELNIQHSSISKCCKGKQMTAGGYIWKYCGE